MYWYGYTKSGLGIGLSTGELCGLSWLITSWTPTWPLVSEKFWNIPGVLKKKKSKDSGRIEILYWSVVSYLDICVSFPPGTLIFIVWVHVQTDHGGKDRGNSLALKHGFLLTMNDLFTVTNKCLTYWHSALKDNLSSGVITLTCRKVDSIGLFYHERGRGLLSWI